MGLFGSLFGKKESKPIVNMAEGDSPKELYLRYLPLFDNPKEVHAYYCKLFKLPVGQTKFYFMSMPDPGLLDNGFGAVCICNDGNIYSYEYGYENGSVANGRLICVRMNDIVNLGRTDQSLIGCLIRGKTAFEYPIATYIITLNDNSARELTLDAYGENSDSQRFLNCLLTYAKSNRPTDDAAKAELEKAMFAAGGIDPDTLYC